MSDIRAENWTKTENTKIKKRVERIKIFSSIKEKIVALFQMRLVTNCSQDLIEGRHLFEEGHLLERERIVEETRYSLFIPALFPSRHHLI